MKKTKKKIFWNYERIFSSVAILSSILTVGVFAYQTYLIREQNKMSVYPHLVAYYSFDPNKFFSFAVSNDGVGPALIEEVKFSVRGKTYNRLESYTRDVLHSKEISKYKFRRSYSGLFKGILLPANKERILVKISPMDSVPHTVMHTIRKKFSNDSLHIKIVYKSIFGEKFMISSDSKGKPVKIE